MAAGQGTAWQGAASRAEHGMAQHRMAQQHTTQWRKAPHVRTPQSDGWNDTAQDQWLLERRGA
eukprot:366069-Chlamydomonas_euryale.AAC.2